jgi:hypothetical protein
MVHFILQFLYWWLGLSLIGLILITFRKDAVRIGEDFDYVNRNRSAITKIVFFILFFFILPFSIPYSLSNIFSKNR